MGMGPRMREDTDYEWGAFLLNLLGLIMALLCLGERGRAVREPPLRGTGWGWVPACARTREGELVLWGLAVLDVSTQRATTRVAPTEAGRVGVRRRVVGMGLGVDVGLPAGV